MTSEFANIKIFRAQKRNNMDKRAERYIKMANQCHFPPIKPLSDTISSYSLENLRSLFDQTLTWDEKLAIKIYIESWNRTIDLNSVGFLQEFCLNHEFSGTIEFIHRGRTLIIQGTLLKDNVPWKVIYREFRLLNVGESNRQHKIFLRI